ncbi:serine hydroxymethyltransferase [Nocardia sp. NBC_00508]|uniref:serine hydroxymethyltransferase n=1 Tax=Nocardia sp. NBC_00508 TaxID=2975992 RepID=UPI002E80E799|nr:serine hydroxymethyltransferase [Nocardia sp. NBC_00508]WUD68709.1 serine hydroxymethyltransferase [Nocardia sp. NBC_00508]
MLQVGAENLIRDDPRLADLLDRQTRYQDEVLAMIASASIAGPAVLSAAASTLSNVTAEGYPGRRYHSGTGVFDEVEDLARQRALTAFGARYVNVQPLSGSSANLAALHALLPHGGRLLSLGLDDGGHLSHGAPVSITGRTYEVIHYGLGDTGRIDFDEVAALAAEHRPTVLIAGASAYPRTVDFQRFREIADTVGAYVIADISHIAGLVAAGVHPSPIDSAHITTSSTYKQLGGPRGGIILSGRDSETPGPDGRTSLRSLIDRAVFPGVQGTPDPASIAAKAAAFGYLTSARFRHLAKLIVSNARALAIALSGRGYHVLTGGTDTHMVVIDLRPSPVTGLAAERALQEVGMLVNRNRVPGDDRPAMVSSGLRLGTNILSARGMDAADMRECAELLDGVLGQFDATGQLIAGSSVLADISDRVRKLCAANPLTS